jgi:hypothetical protein
MGKVTVNHYLNKTIKPRIEGSKELYPLYIQVIANRTNYRFKSNFPFNDGYLRESDLTQEFVIKSNEVEKKEIEKIVNYIQESDKMDLMTAEYIKKCSENFWDVLNRNFGILFENECEKLGYNCPSLLIGRNFFDIDEILTFTESDIEHKFSQNYEYCRIGMNAIRRAVIYLDSEFKELELQKITVFDFLHKEGSKNVLQAVKWNHGFHTGDEETEYQKVLDEITKLISLG